MQTLKKPVLQKDFSRKVSLKIEVVYVPYNSVPSVLFYNGSGCWSVVIVIRTTVLLFTDRNMQIRESVEEKQVLYPFNTEMFTRFY